MRRRSGAKADPAEVNVNTVKVFSATKARDRESLGERVTEWLLGHPEIQVLKTIVAQSSDSEFHCLSIVLICTSGRSTAISPSQG